MKILKDYSLIEGFKKLKFILKRLSKQHVKVELLIGSCLIGFFTYKFLHILQYYQEEWVLLIAGLSAIAFLLNTCFGIGLVLISFVLPIARISLELSILYIIFTFILIKWGNLLNPVGFFVFSLPIIVLAIKVEYIVLAIPLLAGQMVGNGLIYSSLNAMWVIILGLVLGKDSIGPVYIGALHRLFEIPQGTISLNNFEWFKNAITKFNFYPFLNNLFIPFLDNPILLGYVFIWAIVGYIIGHSSTEKRWSKYNFLALLIGTIVLIGGHIILFYVFKVSDFNIFILLGWSILSAILTFAIYPILFEIGKIGSILYEVDFIIGNKKIKDIIPEESWDDMGGLDNIKKEVREAINSQFDTNFKKQMSRFGLKPVKSILLYGPPGCGKTLLARVIAHESKVNFISVSGTEFTSMWFGQSEKNLRNIFEQAKSKRPSILFFDEIEVFLPKREEMARSDAPMKGVIGTFLAYTDGIRSVEGIMIIGATNYPDLIDPAALRPGRFDKLIYIPLPDSVGRKKIFNIHLKDKPLDYDVDIAKLAYMTEHFTGADIMRICEEAAMAAFRKSQRIGKETLVTMNELQNAIQATKPSVTDKMLKSYEEISECFKRGAWKT